jgi:aryl-alcohol dehydrogenase-like predicted oxidoreductase
VSGCAVIQRPALADVWTRAKLDEVLPQGMKRAEWILRYTLPHPHCHTTIVGSCDPEHLTKNLASVAKGPLPTDLYEQLPSPVAALNN